MLTYGLSTLFLYSVDTTLLEIYMSVVICVVICAKYWALIFAGNFEGIFTKDSRRVPFVHKAHVIFIVNRTYVRSFIDTFHAIVRGLTLISFKTFAQIRSLRNWTLIFMKKTLVYVFPITGQILFPLTLYSLQFQSLPHSILYLLCQGCTSTNVPKPPQGIKHRTLIHVLEVFQDDEMFTSFVFLELFANPSFFLEFPPLPMCLNRHYLGSNLQRMWVHILSLTLPRPWCSHFDVIIGTLESPQWMWAPLVISQCGSKCGHIQELFYQYIIRRTHDSHLSAGKILLLVFDNSGRQWQFTFKDMTKYTFFEASRFPQPVIISTQSKCKTSNLNLSYTTDTLFRLWVHLRIKIWNMLSQKAEIKHIPIVKSPWMWQNEGQVFFLVSSIFSEGPAHYMQNKSLRLLHAPLRAYEGAE